MLVWASASRLPSHDGEWRSSSGHVSDPHENPLNRRRILCGGGAAVFAAMMTSLLGGSRLARAQTIAGSVPEVDRVSIRVAVDSYQFAVVATKKVGPVEIQHFGWGLTPDKPPSRTLISEFGLSMQPNPSAVVRHATFSWILVSRLKPSTTTPVC